jgi:tetratricopeptide (TPR) repeat protein
MSKLFWLKCALVFFTLTVPATQRIEAQPHTADYYYERSNWKVYQKNFAGAIEDLGTAIRLQPSDSGNYNARGIVYEKIGNYEAAMADFSYALSLNPYSAEARHNINNLNNKINNAGKYPSGINFTPASVPRSEIPYGNPVNNQTYTQYQTNNMTGVQGQALQQTYRQTGGASAGTPAYSAPARPAGNAPANVQARQQTYRQTDGASVVASAYSAPARPAGNVPANGALSTTGYPGQVTANPVNYYVAQGRDGVKVKADSGVYSPVNSGYSFSYGGNAAYKNIPVFEFPIKKIFIDPDAEKYNLLGVGLNERGRFDEAIKQFNAAIEVYPDYAAAHNNRGVAFAGKGDLKSAALDFDQALRINPYYYDAQFNRERVKSSGLEW